MAQFPWKKGWKGASVSATGVKPKQPNKLPSDTAKSYGGEIAKEYWKRGYKKL